MQEWKPDRLSVISWINYDLANTIFALGVSGLYFAEWLTKNGTSDIALSGTIAMSMAVVIILSPWIGARSDAAPQRVRFLIPTTLMAVVATFFLASVGITGSLIIYAFALIGFNLGSVVYDSLLPDVSTEENRGRISGWGIGVGYVGSIIAVVAGGLLLDSYGYPTLFRTIAVLFLVFALPSFFFIRERPRDYRGGSPPGITRSFAHLVKSWKQASRYDGVVSFLIGRFLYTDAINTLIGGFLTIFAINELGFSDNRIQALLTLAIAASILGGIVGGWTTDRIGPKKVLNGALYLWIITMSGGIVAAITDLHFLAWLVGVAGGFALGMTWAADRVYMAVISPPHLLGEFYGLYATVGRFATLLGPLTWGFIVDGLGFSRSVAMGALIVFVVAARIVLKGVDDTKRIWKNKR